MMMVRIGNRGDWLEICEQASDNLRETMSMIGSRVRFTGRHSFEAESLSNLPHCDGPVSRLCAFNVGPGWRSKLPLITFNSGEVEARDNITCTVSSRRHLNFPVCMQMLSCEA
jgi:hypothetical protein